MQARIPQRDCLLRQQVCVCGHRQIADTVNAREHGNEFLYLGAHKRFTSSQPYLHHTKLHEYAGQPGNLFEGEQVRFLQELVALAENLGGHAVGAAEVAAVGNGDTQVA